MSNHRILERPALTAAQLIAAALNIEAIDTASAPGLAKRRLKGTTVLEAIQRVLQPQTVVGTASPALTIQTGTVILNRAGVSSCTLAAPTAAQAGTRITVISDSANAHTITATGLIDDGVTGGSKTTATFAAFAGASITLEAYGLKWKVVSKNAVTIS